MSLSTEFLDELRARTPLSTLIGRTLRLKKDGKEWKACCPFHQEKTPSFYVNDDKGFYHCFGCSAHGDAIRWLTDQEGMTFLDAVQQLATAAGMEVPRREERQDERTTTLRDATARAAAWFAQQLRGIDGSEARAYLERRGIDDALARHFGIGFAPDSRSRLRSALRDAGDDLLVEAGLLARPDDGRDPYDRFRGRVIFPIEDARGNPIAFSGRIVGSGEPKYLNSPETPLFDKGRTLFNLHRAAPAARKAGRMLCVEGPMDVVGLTRAGIAEAVAPQGTALTEAQLAAMWRVVSCPHLCFDGDAAGRKASARAAIRALPGLEPGRTLSFVLLPAGQDPDDVARNGGAAAVEELLARAIPLAELLWRHEHDATPLQTPEARAALRERLIAHARTIEHRDLAREYEQEFRRRVDAMFDAARRPGKWGGEPQKAPDPIDPASPRRKVLTAVLRGLARYPAVLRSEAEIIGRLPVANEAQHNARELLVDASFAGTDVDPATIDALFPGECGYAGFQLSFVRVGTYPPLAEADLRMTIDVLLAEADGVAQEEIARMAAAYVPPKPPEEEPRSRSGPLL